MPRKTAHFDQPKTEVSSDSSIDKQINMGIEKTFKMVFLIMSFNAISANRSIVGIRFAHHEQLCEAKLMEKINKMCQYVICDAPEVKEMCPEKCEEKLDESKCFQNVHSIGRLESKYFSKFLVLTTYS